MEDTTTETILSSSISSAIDVTRKRGGEEVKLNLYIFKQLSYYLATLDNSKERLLELSLLSKSCFKSFQNIITSYDFNKNKFILSLSQFISYIKSSITTTTTNTQNNISLNNNDDTNNNDNIRYQFKLIQYKEIESIKVPEISKECLTLLNIDKNSDVNKGIHSFLKSNCNQLKKVILLDKVHCFPKIKYDYTCNSFFKVKKLSMIWFDTNPPISYDETVNVPVIGYRFYPFSFNFLLKYNPSKLIIGTGEFEGVHSEHRRDNLYLFKLKNILNCKSIKSIKFRNHPTPVKLLKLILNANYETHAIIKSLSICCIKYEGRSITGTIINSLKESKFTECTTLKKLDIESIEDPTIDYDEPDKDNVDRLLNFIKQNKSLNILKLKGFHISGHEELVPLNEIENITKFIITDIFLSTLKPLLNNTTLKEFHFKNKYTIKNTSEKEYLQLISDFFSDSNNISSLKPSSFFYNKQNHTILSLK